MTNTSHVLSQKYDLSVIQMEQMTDREEHEGLETEGHWIRHPDVLDDDPDSDFDNDFDSDPGQGLSPEC